MDKSRLSAGEEILGSWSVFLGEPRPNSEKLAFKLKSGEDIEFQFGAASPQKAPSIPRRTPR